jgi:hypothetical protein
MVFRKLFAIRYAIHRMVPLDAYHGSDRVDPADNASAFTCRDATGSSSWSERAFDLAVDLDPVREPLRLRRRLQGA